MATPLGTVEYSATVSNVQTTSSTVEATFRSAFEAYGEEDAAAPSPPVTDGITADTILVTADSTLFTADAN